MIAALRTHLFSAIPDDTLYHYTSLQGLMGIVESRTLRASDIRYMNDSTELIYALNLLQTTIASRTQPSPEQNAALSIFRLGCASKSMSGQCFFLRLSEPTATC